MELVLYSTWKIYFIKIFDWIWNWFFRLNGNLMLFSISFNLGRTTFSNHISFFIEVLLDFLFIILVVRRISLTIISLSAVLIERLSLIHWMWVLNSRIRKPILRRILRSLRTLRTILSMAILVSHWWFIHGFLSHIWNMWIWMLDN